MRAALTAVAVTLAACGGPADAPDTLYVDPIPEPLASEDHACAEAYCAAMEGCVASHGRHWVNEVTCVAALAGQRPYVDAELSRCLSLVDWASCDQLRGLHLVPLFWYPDLVTGGSANYDLAAGQPCAADEGSFCADGQGGCAPASDRGPSCGICALAAERGAFCGDHGLCVGDLYCDPQTRTCEPKDGALCEVAGCHGDYYCDPTGRCRVLEVGAPCEPEGYYFELRCDAAGVLRALPDLGEACEGEGGACQHGLQCRDRICSPPSGRGGPCEAALPCLGNLQCVAGRCVDRYGPGAACENECYGSDCVGRCAVPLVCLDGRCGPATSVGLGEVCSDPGAYSGRPCVEGACNTATGRCAEPAAVDSACARHNDCAPGLLCVSNRCAAPAAPGEGCEEFPCGAGSYCDDTLRCVSLLPLGAECEPGRASCSEGQCLGACDGGAFDGLACAATAESPGCGEGAACVARCRADDAPLAQCSEEE